MVRGILRRLVIIGVLLAVASLALAFPDIDVGISDLRLQRGSTGPLGLRLGLDLQGGVHLVYQAVRPPNVVRVTFEEGVEVEADQVATVLTPILADLGRVAEKVESRGLGSFSIQVPCLKAAARAGESSGLSTAEEDQMRVALLDGIGSIVSFNVGGCEEPSADDMEGVASIIERRVNEFGVTEPSVQILGNERLLVQLPGVGDTQVRVTYHDPVTTGQMWAALDPLGRGSARIEQEGDTTFTIRTPSLAPARRDAEGKITEPSEQESIREALEGVGPLQSFEVSGGVEEAKRLIGQTAVLEFKHRECRNELCTDFQDNELNLTGDDLARAFPDRNVTTQAPIVNIEFNSRGARIFGELTSLIASPNSLGYLDRIAIFLDEEELLAPVARQAILGGIGFIEGADFTAERVRTLAIQLESGKLPIPIQVIQERDVDAVLGADALRKSLIAGFIGLGLVLLFMVLYYRVPGLMASGALLSYAVLVLAIFKLFPVTLTLAGMAGFILSIGMAVDANILIFERTKEELRSGRSLLAAIETGFDRAWPSIRDSNVSTFITCLILWWFGTRLGASLVVGFSITLFIGVAMSMFSAIFISRTLLRLSVRTPLRHVGALFTPVAGQTATTPRRQTTRRG